MVIFRVVTMVNIINPPIFSLKYPLSLKSLYPHIFSDICSGLLLFVTGMFINITSDSILRNLRGPGETGYKIPRGGLFEYVSGANFFGEIVEWIGFAVMSKSLPSIAFAFFSVCNIGPRAIHHHQWYLEKFPNYPKDRKAIIPFVL
ncbi:3-oxo-5-alpha-steroid 4-dehydrogenase [Dictyocaulus viviparus]|uniref:3-oxo-5-alpha-steroid 4-dehydrogenase n=1 Tax=Dictyocaulus viviparus TaxID=29172 RepID=A0A0D8Y2A9_DICVI|nr:3-oxo-5-alpha-steroid 4-dehydrogenase [Dictyocaulus viviparus]